MRIGERLTCLAVSEPRIFSTILYSLFGLLVCRRRAEKAPMIGFSSALTTEKVLPESIDA